MKKRRNIGLSVMVVIVIGMALSMVVPSLQQNRLVRSHFTVLFGAIRDRNRDVITAFYAPLRLQGPYISQLFKHPLLGWKITSVSNQPWPLDNRGQATRLYADLYFDLPDSLLKPKGKYERITHPQFGECGIVPVELPFMYDGLEKKWLLTVPDYSSGDYWTAPFEGELNLGL